MTAHTPGPWLGGGWIVVTDPVYRTRREGRIESIDGETVRYFDANAFDGFGGYFEARAAIQKAGGK